MNGRIVYVGVPDARIGVVQHLKERRHSRDYHDRVSTHPARLVLELTSREWKRLRQDSDARAAA